MFERGNLYDPKLLPHGFQTFADLGCNVGFFTCWLSHVSGDRKLKGLMVDANPAAVAEAAWHVQANCWPEVYPTHGIVGENCPSGQADFFMYESNICSASQLPPNGELDGKWEKLSVPCLALGDLWQSRFPAERCHVLKIDIEGSELSFVQREKNFLERVDSIFVEWHKWRVTFSDLRQELESSGFACRQVIDENDQMGTAFFARQSTA